MWGCFSVFTYRLHTLSRDLTSFIEQAMGLTDIHTATPAALNCTVRTPVTPPTSDQWCLNYVDDSCILIYTVPHSFWSYEHLLLQGNLRLVISDILLHCHLLLVLLLILHSIGILVKWWLLQNQGLRHLVFVKFWVLLKQGLLIGTALILVKSHLDDLIF